MVVKFSFWFCFLFPLDLQVIHAFVDSVEEWKTFFTDHWEGNGSNVNGEVPQ